MRVLQIINHFHDGGAATLVVDAVQALRKAGCDVEVATIYGIGEMAQPLLDAGVRIHNLNIAPDILSNRNFNKYDWRVIPALSRIIREGHYDILHVHLFPACYYVALASLLTRPAVVYTEHNSHNKRRERAWARFLDRLVYSRFDAVIGVGQPTTDALRKWLPSLNGRLHTIANALDIARFQAKADAPESDRNAEVQILFVGRMIHTKGVDLLLDAVHKVRERARHPFHVVLCGTGESEDVYRQRAQDEMLTGTVTFLGFRRDIPDLLAKADILALPSRWEGLPMIILEAMVMRLAIVATRVGDVEQVITHQQEGLLIEPESVDALAASLTRLIDDADLRERLGTAARAKVEERHSIQAHVRQLMQIYEAARS